MTARVRLFALTAALVLSGCEGSGAHVVGPKGASAFTRYVAIGTSISMGVQSGGVTASTQAQAWPALLAHAVGADFQIPFLRAPGCTPPLIAPLLLGTDLAGASATSADTSCAGMLGTYTPPLNNVALSGATAFAALNLTPRLVTAPQSGFSAGDRGRYAAVLGTTQSQVTAMLIEQPTFVSVELGANEVLGAVTTGLLLPATSYTQSAPWTVMPAALFAPVYASIVDSVALSKANALLVTVPKVAHVVSLRAGSELYADRANLAAAGIVVAGDCNNSANLVFTAWLVPALAANALASGTPQTLSCTDVSGAVDYVLTPADVAALDGIVDQMNAQIAGLAKQHGWALLDVNAVFGTIAAARAPYAVTTQLACLNPYGQYVSLDGVHPNAAFPAAGGSVHGAREWLH
ncbi:MAG: hypothetical protein HYR75_02570 [Gemmatimonadetes bacterium]|nr:hypothetical protein [Gemmatimonadota bacterium]